MRPKMLDRVMEQRAPAHGLERKHTVEPGRKSPCLVTESSVGRIGPLNFVRNSLTQAIFEWYPWGKAGMISGAG